MDSMALNLPDPAGPAREQPPAARFGPDPLGAPQHSSISEEDYRYPSNRPGGPARAFTTEAGHYPA